MKSTIAKVALSLLPFLAPSALAINLDLFFDEQDGAFDASRFITERAYGFLPVPIIINEPAVDKGLGMMGVFFHETKAEADARREILRNSQGNAARHLLPPSVSGIAGLYTGNDSWGAGAGHMSYFKKGKYLYQGVVGYGDFNLDVYSFNNVPFRKAISTNSEALLFRQQGFFRIGDTPILLGLINQGSDSKITVSREDGFFEQRGLELAQETFVMALGPVVRYDGRDNVFSPNSGLYANAHYLYYDDAFGGDKDMSSALAEIRYFHLFNNKIGAAGRLLVENFDTDELIFPFYLMPAVRMRGVKAVEYQGNSMVQTEGELSYHFNARWMASVFGGYGKASKSFSDMGSDNSIVAYGAGFRYLIARIYGIRAGLDFAYNKDEGMTTYIQVGSAWN